MAGISLPPAIFLLVYRKSADNNKKKSSRHVIPVALKNTHVMTVQCVERGVECYAVTRLHYRDSIKSDMRVEQMVGLDFFGASRLRGMYFDCHISRKNKETTARFSLDDSAPVESVRRAAGAQRKGKKI